MSNEKTAKLKRIANKLLLERAPSTGKRQVLSKNEIVFLLDAGVRALQKDRTLAELEPPVVICGDTHGQYWDVLRLFDHCGWPPTTRYLFLGDYVDRGDQSIEVMCLMLVFKVAFPNDFFLLRGNHECANINRVYGFLLDCKTRYDEEIYWKFNALFEWLPMAGLVGSRIFCMHGGLSPFLESFDQIKTHPRPIRTINGGWLADLLWSDPDPDVSGYVVSNRGISYKFGADAVHGFCKRMDIDMVARAHQVVMAGYELFADSRLVTLFSAPKYCGEFDNAAAMLIVDEGMGCRIKQLTLG